MLGRQSTALASLSAELSANVLFFFYSRLTTQGYVFFLSDHEFMHT